MIEQVTFFSLIETLRYCFVCSSSCLQEKLDKSIGDSMIGNCCADGSGHRDGSAASALAASSNVWSCVAALAYGSCFRGSASLPVFLAEVTGIGGRRNGRRGSCVRVL